MSSPARWRGYRQSYFRQIVWFIIGLGAAGMICLVDYRTLTRWSLVAYGVAILFLVAVLIPHVGSARYGARRWIDLGCVPVSAFRVRQTRVHPGASPFFEQTRG